MSSTGLTGHLSDEQFSDLLAGERPSGSVEAHLATCAHCRGELTAVEGTLTNFNVFSLTWAQREAPRKVHTPSAWALRIAGLPAWGIGLAGATATCLVAIGLGMPIAHEPEPAETVSVVIPVPSDAQIAKDNQLLAKIDQQLRYQAEVAVPTTDLRTSTGPQHHRLELLVSN